MTRPLGCLVVLAITLSFALLAQQSAGQQKEPWGTIKGRVVWGGNAIPKPQPVPAAAGVGCGALVDDSLLVNPKDKGIQHVLIWLGPANAGQALPIHQALQAIKDKEVVMDQPMCAFLPRMVAMREGQVLKVKNSAAMVHNVKWDDPNGGNDGGNVAIPAGKFHEIKGLKASQKLPLLVACNIHPWMGARVGVFDHPYFAVTDASGAFEIKQVPAGNVMYFGYHDKLARLGGQAGKNGFAAVVPAGGVLNLGQLMMQ